MTRKHIYALLVGLSAALLSLGVWRVGLLERWEWNTWDLRASLLARPAPSTEHIKLIVVDEASLAWAKREMAIYWPWPREVYGPILDFCKRGGAKAVAFDVLLVDPSLYGVEQDVALGQAIRRGPPFVAATFLSASKGAEVAWPSYPLESALAIEGLTRWMEAGRGSGISMRGASFPVPEVATNATWLADVKGDPDADGVVRRSRLFRMFDGRPLPTLGLATYLAGLGAAATARPLGVQEDAFSIGETRVPLDADGRTVLRYRGPPGTYARYTAAQVIQSELRLREGGEPVVNPDELRDAFILFGFTAPGLLDLRSTPLSRTAPGVEVHATVLDNLLEADAIRDASAWVVIVFVFLVGFLGAFAVVLSRRALQSVLAFVLLLPVPVLAGFVAYSAGLWWPVVVGELCMAMALVGGVVVNYATEGRQKAFIKRAFKHYLSPLVIERILDDPSRLELGGERRELSIFFSDLQGFSSISERMEPEDLTALLNNYLTDMTDLILEEGGTLDKYEGDAIIAFWNAPVDQPDHAARACRTALRCQHRLAERREEFKKRYGAELHMRIGVNTGEVAVGNMGSRERFDYTVLGDAANLAARLEGANKAFGTYIMVAEATWRKAGGAVVGRELGRLRVVGRQAPVEVYEPLALEGGACPESAQSFEEALHLCYAGKWQEAIRLFESIEDDPAAARYAQRCREVLLRPAEGWDGVWNLTEK
jgi:adenylate cyclase